MSNNSVYIIYNIAYTYIKSPGPAHMSPNGLGLFVLQSDKSYHLRVQNIC